MHYPVNYGFVPHTLSDDGDPIDACVLTPLPIVHGCIIAARPIGVLMMEDESGVDESCYVCRLISCTRFTRM